MYTCIYVGHEIRKETMKEEEEVEKAGKHRRALQSVCVQESKGIELGRVNV